MLTIECLGEGHFFANCKRRNFAHEQANLGSIITDHTPDGGILFFGNRIWCLNRSVEYHYRRGNRKNRNICILQNFALCICLAVHKIAAWLIRTQNKTKVPCPQGR